LQLCDLGFDLSDQAAALYPWLQRLWRRKRERQILPRLPALITAGD